MRVSLLFFTLAPLAIVATVIPELHSRQLVYIPCSGLSGNAVCCATDVLGLADLDCAQPPTTPTSKDDFTAICSELGQRARCCTLPILGQALICASPV
ncbi:hypothetical protein EG328_007761 [Venturia inaequalis]|uniref:Hydrophobin n=1 Tax=Venturia inaequalis TaxID=5025 RepID=A0A8H3VCI2_VENIN|nr:hypothetical protein EG328_007761 [Venturia inaequalis]RDI87268.1 hypothetical protein Vi05172_g2919 [Venturia inaequalis]